MNKYAKEYINSFTGALDKKLATEIKLDEVVAGGKAVYDFFSKPFKDGAQNIQDAKYLKSIGDNQAANAKYWSAAGNFGLGTATAIPLTSIASRVVSGGRAAIPAATSFIPKAWNTIKSPVGMTGLFAGSGFLSARGNNKLTNSVIGNFEQSARQNYPEYSNIGEAFTKPSASSKQVISNAIDPYNQMLSVNPATQEIADKIKNLPTKERIEKSLPYERTLHEIQAMMSQ